MADLPSVYPLHDLFDAAVRGYAIKLTCRKCGSIRIFDPHALWWMFHKRGWADRFADVRKRCVCAACRSERNRVVRWPGLDLVREKATGVPLPMPTDSEWKRELRRRR